MKSNIFSAVLLLSMMVAAPSSGQTIDVTSTGVGIGTSSPGAKLEVVQSSGAAPEIAKFDNTASGDAFISVGSQYNANGARFGNWSNYPAMMDGSGKRIVVNDTNNNLTDLFTNDTVRLRINSSGLVGIGTTSPNTTLHVFGSTTFENSSGINYISLRSHNGGGNYGSCLLFNDSGVNNAQIASTASGNLWFYTGGATAMILTSAGNVGIGTTSIDYMLTVGGPVRASQFIADVNTYSDFVFKPEYKLASLTEVESAIKRDGHLPGIPAEAEVKAHGVDLAVQQAKLLQKVEELTLYLIALQKENVELRAEMGRIGLSPR